MKWYWIGKFLNYRIYYTISGWRFRIVKPSVEKAPKGHVIFVNLHSKSVTSLVLTLKFYKISTKYCSGHRKLVCAFANPLEIDNHNKTEAGAILGNKICFCFF